MQGAGSRCCCEPETGNAAAVGGVEGLPAALPGGGDPPSAEAAPVGTAANWLLVAERGRARPGGDSEHEMWMF